MSASPPLSLGAWLRQQRESRDWTQQDLATRIGCATITLRKIEADERRPSRQIAALLAEQLGVPVRDRAAFVKLARAASAGDFAEKFMLAPTASRSVDSFPSTPPPLIGRAAELETARLLLLNKKTRLLTLTGTGGIGKTRLAVELAAKLAAHFEDGVYWVDLSAIREPARVLSAIAQTLGVRDNVGVPLLENLRDYLRHKQVLLVLDNFEQVIAAAGDVAALFEKARRLKILVTSRERLHVAGERDLPVPPLELPDLTRVQAAPQLSKAASVVLFIQQAHAAKPEFDPAHENVVTIAQICHDLEGIPLALELAAARVKILPIKQIASRLENRFRLLRGGTSGTPVRHQTLWNAIDWSYELLSEAERAVLRRLSAFSGGWSLEAAETVCAGDVVADQDVLDLLTLLVDQSLIQVSEREGAARFRMLETIREYAFERLIESGELARTRHGHLEYFVGLAEEAEPKLSGAEQASWLERLDREEDNLRAAMRWSVSEGGNADLALRLVSALSRFWYTRTYWDEPYERLLGILQAQSTGARTFLRGKALFAVADLATSLEDFVNARALFDEGI
ncbi:MAG: helix-turn-helix domain-containing protein, partial [Chloroflexota bacterium]|nr:helix-turn-helix domain-containing protein [Chloroflexota bacterium]